MSLIIEDGTIIPNANSFATIAEYRAYLLAIGNDTTATDDDTVEQYLVAGMRFVGQRYEPRLQGCRVDSTQSLCMPRNLMVVRGFALESTVIPDDFKNAQIIAAYKVGNGDDLSPDVPQGKSIIREKNKIGVLEIETQWAENDGGGGEQLSKFTEIEEILFPYFKPHSTNYKLYR